jgi:hypothetical protein
MFPPREPWWDLPQDITLTFGDPKFYSWMLGSIDNVLGAN